MEEISATARKLIQDSVNKQIDASLANFKLRLQQLSVQQQQFIVWYIQRANSRNSQTSN